MNMEMSGHDNSISIENAVMDELMDDNGHDNPATIRDICAATDISVDVVRKAITRLLDRGMIQPYLSVSQLGGRHAPAVVYRMRRTK